MAIDLKMPALSPTMEKGTLANWLVAVGDSVKSGDRLAEIETDKATMEFEAVEQGRIAEILIAAGTEDIAVGTVIARLAEEGEETAAPQAEEAEPEPVMAMADAGAPVSVAAAEPAPAKRDVRAVLMETTDNATPLARRIAAIRDIALASVTGSGPNGKIVKADLGVPSLVQPARPTSPAPIMAPQSHAVAPPPEGVPVETVKLSSMRKTIARRLTESKTQVPHFYLTVRCNLDPLLALRAQLNQTLEAQGVKLSVNDMIMKAQALALSRVPDANVQFGGDCLHRFGRADLSMAVAIDGGLVTPVIRSVDTKSLSAIAQESKALAARARDGDLAPEDYSGGTASLSNLGMYGIDEMVPVLNPPQALILGVGTGLSLPWNVDGKLELATVMAATASFDHRAIDGATAAQFMAAFRQLVENPMELLT